jgi:hypothetical protein
MRTVRDTIDMAMAQRDPASVFAEPADVLKAQSLSRRQKLALLEQWEREARSLAVAEEEGMTGDTESMLRRVRRAIAELGGDESAEKGAATTKHG